MTDISISDIQFYQVGLTAKKHYMQALLGGIPGLTFHLQLITQPSTLLVVTEPVYTTTPARFGSPIRLCHKKAEACTFQVLLTVQSVMGPNVPPTVCAFLLLYLSYRESSEDDFQGAQIFGSLTYGFMGVTIAGLDDLSRFLCHQ